MSNIDDMLPLLFSIVKSSASASNKDVYDVISDIVCDKTIPTFYDWMSGKIAIPIWAVEKIIELADAKTTEYIRQVIWKRARFSAGGHTIVNLPRYANPQLAYFIGYLHGDGTLNKNLKDFSVSDSNRMFLTKIASLAKYIFDVESNLFRIKGKNAYRLDFCQVNIHSFLATFCPVGKKKNLLKIPDIFKQNKCLLKWYLTGLFDADGSLGKYENYLRFNFVQSSKNFVFDVWSELMNIGFNIGAPRLFRSSHPDDRSRIILEWVISIHSKEQMNIMLRNFSFQHPDKMLVAMRWWAGQDSNL